MESSCHGSALLYRLLEDYPEERLFIVETGANPSQADQRIEGAPCVHLPPGRAGRLLTTRLHSWASAWMALTVGRADTANRISQACSGFEPEAVLTVAQGYGWLAAARLARERNLPLHLIIHDDWPFITPMPGWLRGRCHAWFRKVYEQSASRLCVSPNMEGAYWRRYGLHGSVLYPSRGRHVPVFDSLPPPPGAPRPFTAAYAGTLATTDYWKTLGLVAQVLRDMGGRLLVYGPSTTDDAHRMGLTATNIEMRGYRAPGTLIPELRRDADVVLIPMSFDPREEEAMRLNFPSKLTDCTAAALPLLVIGPRSSSAAGWVAENPGAALVVHEQKLEPIRSSIGSLAASRELRMALARKAAEAGSRHFSVEGALHLFHGQLRAAMTQATLHRP